MKNIRKIALAEQVVAYARSLGFEDARLQFTDDGGELFDTIEELAEGYGLDESCTAGIHLVLDDDLAFSITTEDPDDEDSEPTIEFAK
jgi:hypothetical protein